MSKTRIVVIKRRQVIFTGIAAILAILLIVVLVTIASRKGDGNTAEPVQEQSLYVPGIYSTIITLGNSNLNLEVVLDRQHIRSVSISSIDEAVTTMYPLIAPSLAKIEEQLKKDVHIDNVVLSEDSRYTQQLLLDAVKKVLQLSEK